MSFSGSDLQTLAELKTNISISDSNAVSLINDSLHQLASLGLSLKIEEISGAVADTAEDLTSTTNGIVLVVDENENIYNLWTYDSVNEQITFTDAGDYTVITNYLCADITAIGDTVSINDLYESALANFLAGQAKLLQNDVSPDGIRKVQQFEKLATSAYNSIIMNNQPAGVREITNAQ